MNEIWIMVLGFGIGCIAGAIWAFCWIAGCDTDEGGDDEA